MKDKLMKVKRVRINWYKLLYQVDDPELISCFWKYYNCHKIKSKNRCARFVLIHYYSTTPAPDFVKKAFNFNRDRLLAQTEVDYELL